MKKLLLIAFISFVIWFILNIILYEHFTNEWQIKRIVENNLLYCEWWEMFWWEAKEDIVYWKIRICSDFKWLKIKTRSFIFPCE